MLVPVIKSSETRDDDKYEGKFLLEIVAMSDAKLGISHIATMPSRDFSQLPLLLLESYKLIFFVTNLFLLEHNYKTHIWL